MLNLHCARRKYVSKHVNEESSQLEITVKAVQASLLTGNKVIVVYRKYAQL